jgi:hypothetical protein
VEGGFYDMGGALTVFIERHLWAFRACTRAALHDMTWR